MIDKILMNFQRTTQLFGSINYTKYASLLLLAFSCLGAFSVKEEKIQKRHIAWLMLMGLLLFFGNSFLLSLSIATGAKVTFYIITLAVGYISILTAGVWCSRLFKNRLRNDLYNRENESFQQETRCIFNDDSINLPTLFYYKKR